MNFKVPSVVSSYYILRHSRQFHVRVCLARKGWKVEEEQEEEEEEEEEGNEEEATMRREKECSASEKQAVCRV